MSEQGKLDMVEEIGVLQKDKRDLEQQVCMTCNMYMNTCTVHACICTCMYMYM